MAKIRNNNISGKLGDKIYSSWHGRPYVRRMPESVANPRTEAQQAHRHAFAAISKLSAAMKEGHAEGLHWKAVREKLNTHCVFRNLNKDCFGPEGIDYSCVKISYGTVSAVEVTSAAVDAEGHVHVEFHDHHPTAKNKKDRFFLFVFCPDLCEGHFAEPVERTVGVVDAHIPEVWLEHELHLYAFMKNESGQTSDTMYLGFCYPMHKHFQGINGF